MTSKKTRPNNAPVRLGQEIELRFEDLLANGQAVGRAGGMAIFVFGPLPNERARVRITTVKQRYAVGEAIEVLERSAARAEPFCPVFGICGGCQVQHLIYEQQLSWKRSVVINTLQRIGGIADAPVHETIGMVAPREYRNKMSLVVEHSKNAPAFGFYKQRSHDVVVIDHCPIVRPALNESISALIGSRSDPELAPAFNNARHVVARTSLATNKTLFTITEAQRNRALETIAPALLDRLPGGAGLGESFDLSSENAILGRRMETLAGADAVDEVVGGLRFRISAHSFFQVNIEVLTRIFEAIRVLAKGSRFIFDLYCGSGAFTLCLAQAGCRVVGIEENAEAVVEARKNAQLNELAGRVEFRRGRVEDVLRFPDIKKRLGAADAVFLDPPRKGAEPEVLSAIASAQVPSIWYLSCDPATLARDLKLLLPKGYRLSNVQPFDMFPQTGHIESLAILSRVEK